MVSQDGRVTMREVYLYFENGVYMQAGAFGAEGTSVGEVVCNTSLSGYQEIITDPSYAGQFITFTMPEIGCVGVNKEDFESTRVHCKGVIVRNYQHRVSNFRAQDSLDSLLKRFGAIGITDIDTRFIAKMLRSKGAMMMVASTEISDKEELKTILQRAPRFEEINYIEEVSTKAKYIHPHGRYNAKVFAYNKPKAYRKRIACLDFGVKRDILSELTEAGFEVEVYPYNTKAQTLIDSYTQNEIVGVFLSNGPGNPLLLKDVHALIRKLIDAKVPMFGVCLGHLLLGIAHGYEVNKLKFGHHGSNHPVKNLDTAQVEITAQSHNYTIDDSITEVAQVTHKNLFDGTIGGLRYKDAPIISVQYQSKSSSGSLGNGYIFEEFHKLIQK